MKRVLQVTSKLFRGGAESFIMNVYRNINREELQFDFLTFHSPREYYESEIESLGGRVYHVPVMEGTNFIRRRAMLGDFFDNHNEYVAVHGHMAALGQDYLHAAAEHGITKRFAHSHTANYERTPRNIVKQVYQKGFGKHATMRLACSHAAGIFMFPNQEFIVINNGIDIDRFTFDQSRRSAFREQLLLSKDDAVVGHAGRFEIVKNHEFLIEIFKALVKKDPTIKLLLAGDGPLRQTIEDKVSRLGLEHRVLFLGAIDDMPSFYDGIDCFIMPSLYEGMPFSALEAQCSGLPNILSTGITTECSVTDLVRYQALDDGSSAWANRIQSVLATCVNRKRYPPILRDAGFDIADITSKLENLYLE